MIKPVFVQLFFTFLFVLNIFPLFGQAVSRVSGKVFDAVSGNPIELVSVYLEDGSKFTETDHRGEFSIEVPSGIGFKLGFSRLSYVELKIPIEAIEPGRTKDLTVRLSPIASDIEVIVKDKLSESEEMIREETESLKTLPSASGNLEAVLPHIALGTSSGTGGELSSQYNVRGGNYDENLVYINDFEVYRPLLIRSGIQEGLSFPNIDLIRELSFSSGGFQAKYGDKMSSVLDIRYKQADSLAFSLSGSMLGASAHIEGSNQQRFDKPHKFRYLAGVRYKTSRYLLGSLEVDGEYIPDFFDFQTYLTYTLNPEWHAAFLGNVNLSKFSFKPLSRSTAFGLTDFALELNSSFTGTEKDAFNTAMAGVSLTYLPERKENPFFLKFLASGFSSDENEAVDIIGSYQLAQIETELGEDQGEIIRIWGDGIQHQYIRNFLNIKVGNIEHKGGYQWDHINALEGKSSHFIQWGTQFKYEYIFDKINEWERLDSAGFSLPYDPGQLLLSTVYKSKNELNSSRLSGYFQHSLHRTGSKSEWRLSSGIRATRWSLNRELVVSPRFQWTLKPLNWERDIAFKFAAGQYAQAPFYRELRNPQGEINNDIKSQKSLHFVAGWNWNLHWNGISDKPFRWITEFYYKKLWDLVPYEIDNVRIRYSGENEADGYVFGLDTRINGEFVPGAESWINLSFLSARERIDGVTHLRRELGSPEATEQKTVPRPSDRFMNMAIFFQDYLPQNENMKMHLNLVVGTGLPFGLKDNNRVYRNTYRYSPYHRVDIGFSALLWNEQWAAKKPGHPLRFTKNAWLSLEVFNLLQIRNEASNTWIKSIYNIQFAIPNHLTSRRINLRVKFDF